MISQLSDLLNNEIEETFPFRGQTYYIIAKPDAYTMADAIEINEKTGAEIIAGYVLKGLAEFGVKNGEDKKPFAAVAGRYEAKLKVPALTEELLIKQSPMTFTRQMLNRIESLKISVEGKPNTSPS